MVNRNRPAWLLMFFCVAAALPARAQDTADELSLKAHKAYDSARYDEAIADWDAAQKLASKDASVYFNRAAAYADNGEIDKAVADYSEVIRLNPGDEEAIRLRARLYLKQGENAKAVEDFSTLIRLKPGVRYYLARADVHAYMGEYGKAVADYSAVIKLEPDDKSSYGSRVNAYMKLGEWDKAVADYTQMIRLDPQNDAGYYGRGEAYFKMKDYDRAIADVSEAISVETAGKMEPGHGQGLSFNSALDVSTRHSVVPAVVSLVMRGTAYSRKGMYDKALEDFNLAITRAATSPLGYNAAALLYASCPKAEFRDGAKAVEFAEEACDVSGWKNDEIIDTLAAAEAEAGKWKEAVDYEKMAMDMAAKKKDKRAMKEYTARLALYKVHKPYREEPGK